jgi:iron complex outermembrane recepter protein
MPSQAPTPVPSGPCSKPCCFRAGIRVCRAICLCVLCARAAVAQPATAPTPAPVVSPPRVLASEQPELPSAALGKQNDARVELIVTIDEKGTVVEVEVASSGGAALDAAAEAAVRRWRFTPALRDDRPVKSRIRIPFLFTPPALPSAATRQAEPRPPTGAMPAPVAPDAALAEAEPPLEVTVHGEREGRTEDRAISDFRVEHDVLAAAPRSEGAEVLRAAPGLYVGRGEGPAVAHNYMLRGFDADHGQDLELRVGGLPINLPSHLHGQGYADLGFLISDVVRALRVSEGVYDPRQGDFAVAGSIDVELGVGEAERGTRLRSSYGSFDTFRQLVLWAPRGAAEETFGAAHYLKTAGFGQNRGAESGSGIFQQRFGSGDVTYRALVIVHTARSESAGVVRTDDVESGKLCFDCVYPFPTAREQNALATRVLAGVFADFRPSGGSSGQLGAFLGYDTFRQQSNYTGFLERSRTLDKVSGRGDLIEQQNRTLSFGVTGRYRGRRAHPTSWAHGTVEVGADGRLDVIDQAQNLLDGAVRGQTWDRRVDAAVRGVDLGFWGDLDWVLWRRLHARLGLRADLLSYDIEDRLGNFAPLTRSQDQYIVGFRRSAMGMAWGPRTSFDLHVTRELSLLAAYGEGYRSPQARLLEDGERAPFTKVRSADAGVRLDFGDSLRLTVGGFYTRLSDDIAFDAGEGRLERIGATRRRGATAQLVSRPTPWLVQSLSLTVVDATLLEQPPGSAEDPQPPFVRGQQLPFVPPVVMRADIGAERPLFKLNGATALVGRAGLGFSFLSPRPLPYGGHSAALGLLDASVGAKLSPFELRIEGFNLLGRRYAAVEYNFPSDWDPLDGVRPRTPTRHMAAGAPRSFLVSLGLTL